MAADEQTILQKIGQSLGLVEADPDYDPIIKRKFTAEDRDKLASEGKAMPDKSFPIENEEDLKNAIRAVGRASDPEKAKAHIIKRARALGLTDKLPDDWKIAKDGEPLPNDSGTVEGVADEKTIEQRVASLETTIADAFGEEGSIAKLTKSVEKLAAGASDDEPKDREEVVKSFDDRLGKIVTSLEDSQKRDDELREQIAKLADDVDSLAEGESTQRDGDRERVAKSDDPLVGIFN